MAAAVLSALLLTPTLVEAPPGVEPPGPVPAVRVVTGACVTDEASCHPPPTPPPLIAPSWASCGQWWPLAHAVGWPVEQLPKMDAVMVCESRCRPTARNPSGAAGLMQVMPMHWHGRDPHDPESNLTIALEVWRSSGWRAWSCA